DQLKLQELKRKKRSSSTPLPAAVSGDSGVNSGGERRTVTRRKPPPSSISLFLSLTSALSLSLSASSSHSSIHTHTSPSSLFGSDGGRILINNGGGSATRRLRNLSQRHSLSFSDSLSFYFDLSLSLSLGDSSGGEGGCHRRHLLLPPSLYPIVGWCVRALLGFV
ncbi:hypothetical protein PIB30_087591, partial [Stylosanthes scabra]|nr:hypothetical protein [Stylosanthes scabra]